MSSKTEDYKFHKEQQAQFLGRVHGVGLFIPTDTNRNVSFQKLLRMYLEWQSENSRFVYY